jgi:hypothetical protein
MNSILSVTENLVRIQINTETNWIKTLIKNSFLAHFALGFLNLHWQENAKGVSIVEPLQEQFPAFSVRFLPALWNCNYFLRFRFQLLKSYGSSSDFWKVTVPVPTFEKLRFRFRFQLHV